MVRQRTTATPTTTTTGRKPGLLSRLGGKKQQPARVTESTSTNPITGNTTTTRKTTTHKSGLGHHGHGGSGPLSSTNATSSGAHGPATKGRNHGMATTGGRTQRRKPSVGDKMSGAMMKLKGSLTRKPGVKAAGTRRMHGTDGKGTHKVY
ncbi:hypothetical protein Q7P37_008972 [Cladosporium fusiforme]